MGHCSNRSESKDEKISRWAKEISNNKSFVHGNSEESFSRFHSTTGAEIRGVLGTDKGNAFIEAIKKANQ